MTKFYLSISFLLIGSLSIGQSLMGKLQEKGAIYHPKVEYNYPGSGEELRSFSNQLIDDTCGNAELIKIPAFKAVPPTADWKLISKSKIINSTDDPKWQKPTWADFLHLPTTLNGDLTETIEVDEWAITPDIAIPANVKTRVVFRWRTSFHFNVSPDEANYTDIQLKVAVGGGATDTSVYEEPFFEEGVEAKIKAGGVEFPYKDWKLYSSFYDLSAYAGKTINIAIHAKSNSNKGAIQFDVANFYVEVTPNTDLTILDEHNMTALDSVKYFMIPFHQQSNIIFEGIVRNNGLAAQATKLNVHISNFVSDGEVYNKSSAPVSLAPEASQLMNIDAANGFTPPNHDSLTTYRIKYSFLSDSLECQPRDNVRYEYLVYNDSLYARDDLFLFKSPGSSISNIANGAGDAFQIGNVYQIFNTNAIQSVQIGIGSDTKKDLGQIVSGQVYLWDTSIDEYKLIGKTPEYTLENTDIPSLINLKFEDPVEVKEGDFVLVTAGHQGGNPDGSDDVRFMTAGSSRLGEVQGMTATNEPFNLLEPNTPVVRINFGTPISVPEEKYFGVSLKDMYPNPANEVGYIGYEVNKATTVQFKIFEASGKIVKEWNEGKKTNGKYTSQVNLNNLNPGLYFYSLVTERGVITKRFSLIR